MTTVGELAHRHTAIRGAALAHVRRLASSWRPLADLSFSDLLLLAPIAGEEGHRFVVLEQVRPVTGQTLYPADMVGTVIDEVERPLLARAWRRGDVVEGETTVIGAGERVRVKVVPVRHRGEIVALLTRETATTSFRRPGELERYYFEAFDRFAVMIAEGTFPFGRDEVEPEEAPRVGDGVILLETDTRIRFVSPNAVSSLHRMGIHSYASGLLLAEIGFDDAAVDAALRARAPVTEELEQGDVSILLRVIPVVASGEIAGAVVLLRDVTDIRTRDRMLMSKDATIREIHHRVKNNLQTIAALLRLQGRRLSSREARQALQESERRIRSIAIVHETLSRDAGGVVPFDEVIRPLVRVVEETVSTPDAALRFHVEGDAGDLPGEVATPLAVVLNELMQNAVDHAFPRDDDADLERRDGDGRVVVRLNRRNAFLEVEVVDDGVGLPDGFTIVGSKGLGLSIVETLVTGELGGSIDMHRDGGTRVSVRIPVASPAPLGL